MAKSETSAASSGGTSARQDPDAPRDPLDEQEDESFPASDPHSDWAGAPAERNGDD